MRFMVTQLESSRIGIWLRVFLALKPVLFPLSHTHPKIASGMTINRLMALASFSHLYGP